MWWTKLLKPFETILGAITNPGKERRALERELKVAELRHKIEIQQAQTKATVEILLNNNQADNNIDLITAQDKKYTYKDEIISAIIMLPFVNATLVVPFIRAKASTDWVLLHKYIVEGFKGLEDLPDYYMWMVIAVVMDILGLRSFVRQIINSKTTLKNPFKNGNGD